MATHYKQPSRINGVSVGLVLVLALAGWLGASGWPLLAAHANLKNEIEDALPRAYKSNLLPEPTSTAQIEELRDDLAAKLPALGITDPKREVVIGRDAKTVSIEVRYQTALVLLGVGKRYPLSLHTRVQTDAARIDW